jgi:hypothetical protein
MKRLVGLFLMLVLSVVGVGKLGAQDDSCAPEVVVATFADAVKAETLRTG